MLIKSPSKKALSRNIETEIKSGKRPDVAAGIAYRVQREAKKQQVKKKK
jgi:hypothetical protein